jgi:phthalate 4,5-dioxygenase oxygenase subunit
MLSEQENELVTRVGPGTPMGQVLRRYWMPALLSAELPEPDGTPVRVKLLGERLVAYRDTEGKVGLLDELCGHRRASLWLGRNEESGLRCVFHGWKFDRAGNCVDMPCETPETDFSAKVHIKAYPVAEMGGVVWAYMGPPEFLPPEPRFEWTQVPDSQRNISKTWEECNWLQALEGGVDSAHSSFLHRALGAPVARGGFSISGYRARSTAPRIDVQMTDWGYTYASRRPLGEEGDYIRTYHYVMPFHQLRAAQVGDGSGWRPLVAGHMWVPMDDENCMVYNWRYHFGDVPLEDGDTLLSQAGGGEEDQLADYRKIRNKDNDWLIDRQIQKTKTYTGIDGINTQDHAVQESMGPIVDRSQEHLGSIDRAIIATRRLLLRAVETVADGGVPVAANDSYYRIRALERVLPTGTEWWEAMGAEIRGEREPVPAGAR